MMTSSKLRWCACLRACANRRLVLSSSTVTRRPRSAMRSMVFLLSPHQALFKFQNALAPRPILPHAELEHGEIGGFQQSARRHHDVGRGYRVLRYRREFLAGFAAGPIKPAGRRDQRLQSFGRDGIEIAV